jgi:flagellar P-ring protein precursor FlgI
VINDNVRLGRVAVSHGSIQVTIATTRKVSQPLPLSEGSTEVVEESQIEVSEGTGDTLVLEESSDIRDLVDALNLIGARPQDIINILREIKAAGALYGELIVR